MKKLFICSLLFAVCSFSANAYQVLSSKELGRGDAKNQNVVVKCTTDRGQVSNQTCTMRRYAKCTEFKSGNNSCNGWHPWTDLRNPGKEYSTWQAAANECCRAKGLR
jgi:hypothetical protein